MKLKNRIVALSMSLVVLMGGVLVGLPVSAEDEIEFSIGVSPMNESIILNPGDTYRGAFNVSNPGYAKEKARYYTEVGPFYVDENYDPVYEDLDGKSTIVDWIKVTSGATGELNPNDVGTVEFEINVPEDAPAGGQYATISTYVDVSSTDDSEGISIGESMGISHVILAEITGNTITSGRVIDMGIRSFVLDGDIAAYSLVENTGNVHLRAVYGLKVYPLFSDTPVYTNEDVEDNKYILPGRTYQGETVWEDTPTMGIYNVEYTVDYMGSASTVTRMVIVCPWWILMIIGIGLILMILRIVAIIKIKNNKKVKVIEEL